MAGLLSLLAGGARAGIAADTGALQGQQVRRDREQKDLLAQLAQQRQSAQDAQESERMDLLNQLTRAQTAKMGQPGAENIDRQYDPLRGVVVDVNAGTFKPLAGLPERPTAEPPRNIDPLSQPGIDAAVTRAKAIAGAQGSIGRSPRAPTAEQEKSYNWHQMMSQAAPVLEANEEKIRPDAIWAAINAPDWTAPALNRMLSPEEQQYFQAIRSFGAGMLRKESGAAFGPGELADIFRRIGPTGGNAPGTVEQIRASRKSIMDAMNMMATPARMYYEATQGGGVPEVTEEEQLTGAPGVQPNVPRGTSVPSGPPVDPGFAAWLAKRGARP